MPSAAPADCISTFPADTVGNMARDSQWGQGLQLVEDYKPTDPPASTACASDGSCKSSVGSDEARTTPTPVVIETVPFEVSEGEGLELVVRSAFDSMSLQFQLLRLPPPAPGTDL